MKTNMRRICGLVMTLALLISMIPVSGVNVGAATKTTLNKTTATITAGKTTTLSVKNAPKKATVTWSTGAKKIATVTSKGKVTGVSAGTTKITAKVKSGKKTTKHTCSVTVKGISKNVSTNAQLQAALKNKAVSKITIKTDKAAKFTIPKGTYNNVTLVVDAPNADVVNSGVFKTITVKAIKSDTFTENAKGNKINVTADSARFVVSSGAQLSSLTFSASNANVKLVANGTVKVVNINAAVSIDISGKAGSVAVNVSKSAAGAEISSSVTVAVSTAVDIKLDLSEGAEGSTVSTKTNDVNVEVNNGTSDTVEVVKPNTTDTVESGSTSSDSGTDDSGAGSAGEGDGSAAGGGGSAAGGGGSVSGGDGSAAGGGGSAAGGGGSASGGGGSAAGGGGSAAGGGGSAAGGGGSAAGGSGGSASGSGDSDTEGGSSDPGSDDNTYTPTVTISISGSVEELVANNTNQLAVTAKVDGNDASVIWSSDNEKVAAVDSTGVVTGVTAGTATITATVENYPAYSASMPITIVAATAKIRCGDGAVLYTGSPNLAWIVDTVVTGDAITLLRDFTSGVKISDGNSITIDLNGHTIDNYDDIHTITVESGAALTIKDTSEIPGTVTNTANGKAAIYNEGIVIIDGGTFEGTTIPIELQGSSEITINGGTFNGTQYSILCDSSNGAITISIPADSKANFAGGLHMTENTPQITINDQSYTRDLTSEELNAILSGDSTT